MLMITKVTLKLPPNPQFSVFLALSDLMEMVTALVRMKEITPPTPKVEKISRATQERHILIRENPEVEDVPQLSEERP